MSQRVETYAKIMVYEIDGERQIDPISDPLEMKTHWVHEDRVRIKCGDHWLTVMAADLRTAIDRCSR